MLAAPGLTDCAASVVDADPRLSRLLGAHDAAAVGRAALLPVLAVAAGEWMPPERGALGAGTTGLVVLSGLLTRDGMAVLGPGDLLDPWLADGAWLACTPVRLAVLGGAFAAALEAWPDVAALAARPRERALSLRGLDGGAPAERLLAALWRLAARWGRPVAGGLALPTELGVAALARLLELPEPEVAAAARALRARRLLARRDGGGWLLPPPVNGSGRRDGLRARLAEQCAAARVAREEAGALCEQLDSVLRQRSATRATRRSV